MHCCPSLLLRLVRPPCICDSGTFLTTVSLCIPRRVGSERDNMQSPESRILLVLCSSINVSRFDSSNSIPFAAFTACEFTSNLIDCAA